MRTYELNGGKAALHTVSPRDPEREGNSINRNYSGPGRGTVLASNRMRIENIGILGQYDYLKEEVLSACKRFVDNYFVALGSMHNTIDVQWVTACKQRHQELFKLFTAIVQQDGEVELCIVTNTGKLYSLDDVKFCPKKYTVKAANLEEETILDVYISQNYPKIYAPLFVAMFKVAMACQECRESDPDTLRSVQQLAFALYEVGGLYNETNPDPKEWRRQEDSTIEILSNPPTREEDSEVMAVFKAVIEDIQSGCEDLKRRRGDENIPPYVREICKAITSNWRFLHSDYTDEDLYVSMSADAALVEELNKLKITASILKSALEKDPMRDCEFDKHVKFESHYNFGPYDHSWIKTIHIPNPGKFKTRAIHLALAAIQDRCAYIHRRLYRLLQSIPSDCTKEQEKGIRFTLKITDPTWREDRMWPSVLAFDWSNATDKLWSWFQEQVLLLVFDKEIVDFWHIVSTCPKSFYHRDGDIQTYNQVNGQPQGLLGSFDAFALAHHIIMLMTMKMSHRDNFLASEFYRILGDDSIISSITLDKGNTVGEAYVRICKWCNVPVNRVKSTEILFDQPVALVEFAKVYALNGEYFSPIPERLANRIGSPGKEYYAFAGAFWGQRHGMDNVNMLRSMIDKYYPDHEDNRLAKLLLFSGTIPCFSSLGKEFSDPEMAHSEDAVKLTLCYWFNKIKATFALNGLSDKAKEWLGTSDKELKDALLEFIPEELSFLLDRIEDEEHKLFKVIQSNLDKESVIKQFLDCSSDQAIVIAATVKVTSKELDGIRQVLEMVDLLSERPEAIPDYSLAIMNLGEKLEPLERLNYRSIYKRDSLNLKVFRSTIEMFKKLFVSRKITTA